MPLIIVTGLPSSGKTTTSEKIASFIKARLKDEGDNRQVKIVSDSDELDFEGRDSIYTSILKEKELRGWLRAEVQRYVNLNHIVILDSAAYIKGFRYELYCVSKEAKSQYCVVELLPDPQTCWNWNLEFQKKAKSQDELEDNNQDDPLEPELGYSRKTFDALVMRYEKCDKTNRWDSPLFRIDSEKDELDLDNLYTTITKSSPLKPNQCTSLTSTTTSIYKPNR